MKDRIFIDTNILVYANDSSEPEKQKRCKNIILNGIKNQNITLSAQVLSEFFVTVTQKIKKRLPFEIAKKEVLLLRAVEIVDIDYHSVIQAMNISKFNELSYWDSLIVSSARKAMCNILYTEDLNHGQVIESVRIENPFIS